MKHLKTKILLNQYHVYFLSKHKHLNQRFIFRKAKNLRDENVIFCLYVNMDEELCFGNPHPAIKNINKLSLTCFKRSTKYIHILLTP